MPNLVRGEGITKENAERMLERRGFTEITWVPVESFLPAGVVVSQSVEADTLIDITTPIIIEYSNGVRPIITVTYTFDLSDVFEEMGISSEESFLITIMQGSTVVVENVVIQPGTTSYTLSLTGRNYLEYTIYVNWNYFKTVTVDFV
jgi:beta-lactam-binding protein with PASTA domain